MTSYLLQYSHRHIQTPLHYELCYQDEEDETHLFLQCSFARAIWYGFKQGFKLQLRL